GSRLAQAPAQRGEGLLALGHGGLALFHLLGRAIELLEQRGPAIAFGEALLDGSLDLAGLLERAVRDGASIPRADRERGLGRLLLERDDEFHSALGGLGGGVAQDVDRVRHALRFDALLGRAARGRECEEDDDASTQSAGFGGGPIWMRSPM